MTHIQETEKLRSQLSQWAAAPEWKLMVRYELLPQKPLALWHQRLSHKAARLLRQLGLSRHRYMQQQWQVGLKHAHCQEGGKTLLIWSEGDSQECVRQSCAAIKAHLQDHHEFTPVLVTDMADFAFYSRLGWLVEYLPHLPGNGKSYLERKRRYLAWRYRDALAIPLSAALSDHKEFTAMLNSGAIYE